MPLVLGTFAGGTVGRAPQEVRLEVSVCSCLNGPATTRLPTGHRQATSALGREPAVVGVAPWMDGVPLTTAGIPTVIVGPGGAGAHASEAWAALDSVARCADIVLATAEACCG